MPLLEKLQGNGNNLLPLPWCLTSSGYANSIAKSQHSIAVVVSPSNNHQNTSSVFTRMPLLEKLQGNGNNRVAAALVSSPAAAPPANTPSRY